MIKDGQKKYCYWAKFKIFLHSRNSIDRHLHQVHRTDKNIKFMYYEFSVSKRGDIQGWSLRKTFPNLPKSYQCPLWKDYLPFTTLEWNPEVRIDIASDNNLKNSKLLQKTWITSMYKSILHTLLKSCVELCNQNFRHGRTVKDTEVSMFKDILEVCLLTDDRETSTF